MPRNIFATVGFYLFCSCFLLPVSLLAAPERENMETDYYAKKTGKSAVARILQRSNTVESLPANIAGDQLGKRIENVAQRFLGVEPGDMAELELTDTILSGPWFRGWYTRITDSVNDVSLAVVGASQYLPDKDVNSDGTVPGYVAVIVNYFDKNGEEVTAIYDAFPEKTEFWTNRELAIDDPDSTLWEEFYWHGKGTDGLMVTITNETISVSMPNLIEMSATIGERNPYNPVIPWLGPEGLVEFLPFLPLHWFVHSMGSNASYQYTLTLPGEEEEVSVRLGNGYAHQETNWGSAFPPAWIWAEGISKDNDRQFVLSGGVLDLGDVSLTEWMVAYHSPVVKWQFRPTLPGTKYQTEIDACLGYFSITAKDDFRKLVITAQAPGDSFVDVAVPTANGFQPEADESFSTAVEIKAYIKIPFFGYIPVDKYTFQGAALEFGAEYSCD